MDAEERHALVLSILRDGPLTALDIHDTACRRVQRFAPLTQLYPLLDEMVNAGAVERSRGPTRPGRGGRPTTYYRLTDSGLLEVEK